MFKDNVSGLFSFPLVARCIPGDPMWKLPVSISICNIRIPCSQKVLGLEWDLFLEEFSPSPVSAWGFWRHRGLFSWLAPPAYFKMLMQCVTPGSKWFRGQSFKNISTMVVDKCMESQFLKKLTWYIHTENKYFSVLTRELGLSRDWGSPVTRTDRWPSGEVAQGLGSAGRQVAAAEGKHWLPQNFATPEGGSGSPSAIYSFSEISKSDNLVLKFP